MGKNQSASNLVNIIQYNNGNISFVSGSTTLMQISSSGAITTTGVISGSNAQSASYALTASSADVFNTRGNTTIGNDSSSLLVVNSLINSNVFPGGDGTYNLGNNYGQQWNEVYANTYYGSLVGNANSANTASFATNAATASSADSLTVRGTLTAQTLVVQTITSSVDFVTGSTRFGSISSNTHQFTGSMSVSGSATFSSSVTTTNLILNATSSAGSGRQEFYSNGTRVGYIGTATWATGEAGTDFTLASVGGLRLATGDASTKMIITGSTVGIGTNSPTADYDKSLVVYGGNPSYIVQTNDNTGYAYLHMKTPSYDWSIGYDGATNFKISNGTHPAASTKLTIASTGDSTFTTTNNQGGLTVTSAQDNTTIRVSSTATGGQEWRIQSTGGTSGLGQGKLFFKVGTTETAAHIPLVLTTDNSTNGGRVGIGTTNPGNKLHVVGGGILVENNQDYRTKNSSGAQRTLVYMNSSNKVLLVNDDGDIILSATGNIGIGTTAPSTKLHVVGDSILNGSISIHNGMTLDSNNYSNSITTSWVSIGPTTLFVGLAYVYWANDSSAVRDFALISFNYYPAGVTTIASSNNGGNGVVFQMNGSSLQMRTTSGTVIGTQVVWFKV